MVKLRFERDYLMRQYKIIIRGFGYAVVKAENRSKAFNKAYKQVKEIGYYSNLIEFKKDVISLRLLRD